MGITETELIEYTPIFGKELTYYKKTRYSRDWIKVCEEYKKHKNWLCEECGLDCSITKYYLHVHHLNENKFNNSWRNLKAVCRACNSQLYK
ncbi:MAG: HNH endonuclease [Peptostreptococcaceae bacterium]